MKSYPDDEELANIANTKKLSVANWAPKEARLVYQNKDRLQRGKRKPCLVYHFSWYFYA
jgi:hypothetical protein